MIRTALKRVNSEIQDRQNTIVELRSKIDKAEPLTYQDVENIAEDWERIASIQANIKGLEIAKSILEDLCLSLEQHVSG
jgi:hypothetical protein